MIPYQNIELSKFTELYELYDCVFGQSPGL